MRGGKIKVKEFDYEYLKHKKILENMRKVKQIKPSYDSSQNEYVVLPQIKNYYK